MACKTCRARKIRCDQARPVCQNCRLRASHCTYAGERRIRRSTHDGFSTRRPFLSATYPRTPSTAPESRPRPAAMAEDGEPSEEWICVGGINPFDNDTDTAVNGSGDGAHMQTALQARQSQTRDANLAVQSPYNPDLDRPFDLLDQILEGDTGVEVRGCHPAVWMRTEDGDEYTGPSSGIATISDLGLSWLHQHVPDSDELCESIQDIRNTLLAHLRQAKCTPHPSPSSPSTYSTGDRLKTIPPSVIKKYVDAYFSTVQTIFPVLDQHQFELQLARFGTDPSCKSCSWKALLNAVLASGCRAALSHETAESFQESGRESWGYFQNALSYESNIVHSATDLMGVQAFAVMTVFAQGLSSPQRLEYTLCSIASRLAQGIALNRHPSQEWNLSEEENSHRARTFWVIYCLDKTISLRCGRPSAVDDDEISCPFPRGVRLARHYDSNSSAAEEVADFDCFLSLAKFARICGAVSRRLYSATALNMPSTQLSGTLERLMQDLEAWKQAIPPDIQPGIPFGRIADSKGLTRFQLVALHSSYYYIICAMCRRFTPMFTKEIPTPNTTQKTMNLNLEAARAMVLLTKHLDVESFTPGWLGFYYPFTALTTLFAHVVTSPNDTSTRNDIALMEVVVGFFGRLEYITSGEAAFTKTTEFVRLARRIADRYADAARSESHRRDSRDSAAATNTAVPLAARPEMDAMPLDPNKEIRAGDRSGFNMLPDELLSNGNGDAVPGRDAASVRRPAAEPAAGNTRNGSHHDDISSQALFTDVMNLLDKNGFDVTDDNWLENWTPPQLTGS
ncbi:fungal-specific transcription factor domain-containing protein [Dactylonectria estremocensis]|uniref:Fungal-specific transcription factor domain-containing protein n=1 Tax=Dactylonectria estremocensis TaxID=1079267 RepID=A0A9P9FD00_9HYPO|nr:fungal-specific transcription factor domain-containing protein [Dactylonectria estremocensis]